MADSIMALLEQNPTTGIAVGGAIVAAAVGLTAAKALGGKAAPEATAVTKKKKKSKAKKKTPAASAPADKENASDINLEEFVDDGPDSEEEEAIRAEKRKLKLKQKKKNAKAKQRAAASSSGKPVVETDKEKEKKKAAAVANKKDTEDGWETVVNKKKSAKPKQQ
ncbi:hypothetical protein GN244_ATG08958 [Phytophthora infestans]|uniref:Uncharacterized protein n=1 Tax=Phytophthora infestans TaxID=4787 RepID=A0A833SUQ9_PHYIN|nr:hypothetical protein GN244_ATG08958 [Phytophthora infestans]KAF4135430.1 hypothetical protein GN958_ATG15386 [Phytophthora infestans]